jgi:N-dimethylarginine dimethylaminohydrolase
MHGAQSEYCPLKTVIMHRPSDEVELVTESNTREFLFRHTVQKEEMQKEHDSYVQFLTQEDVTVIPVHDTVCPNLVFTRDTASVTKKGALLMRPRVTPRHFEPFYLEQTFESLGIPTMEVTRGYCEGGDLVYLNEDTLMVGFGPRTDLDGVVQVKQFLLGETVKEIIAVPLPRFRVHLDGALMILSHDLAILHPGSLLYPAQLLKEKEVVLLPEFLHEQGFDLITVTDKEVANFGPNILVVKPTLAVSYSWNTRIISELEERSFDVFALEGHELAKAAGGPHCMVCPVLRDEV